MERKEFHYAFQISRMIIFGVDYYTLGSNKHPYFATSAGQFNQPKTDYNRCGQSQNALLKPTSLAHQFYDKWNNLHLKDLTDEQYKDLVNDIEGLKKRYNYVAHISDEPRNVNGNSTNYQQKFAPIKELEGKHPTDVKFWECKKLSMMPTKEKIKETER